MDAPYLLGHATDDGQISYLLQPAKVKVWLKKGKKMQCISNRYKDLFKRKNLEGHIVGAL